MTRTADGAVNRQSPEPAGNDALVRHVVRFALGDLPDSGDGASFPQADEVVHRTLAMYLRTLALTTPVINRTLASKLIDRI